MLSVERNERLTRVGPGTPTGELLRRYWYPIAALSELDQRSVIKVRLLAEDLVLYRDQSGTLGLVAEACPHRRASLAYGIPEETGIRCPYHGWVFDGSGRCLEQPAEPDESTFKNRIRTTAYRVEALGGLVFAYLGPEPAPLLPRFDLFVWDGVLRSVGRAIIPCNWLQIMENSVDATHVEWLHGRYYSYVLDQRVPGTGGYAERFRARHLKVGFDVFDWGIIKRRVVEGTTEADDDWAIGHPLVFPSMLRVGNEKAPAFQIRVPVDDTTTAHYWYYVEFPDDGAVLEPQSSVPLYEVPITDEDGRYIVDYVDGQDVMCWVSQGAIADRSQEHLGISDKGVILLRSVLTEQIQRVADGLDPMGVVRDPAANEVIVLPQERKKANIPGDRRTKTAYSYAAYRYNPHAEQFQNLLHPVQ